MKLSQKRHPGLLLHTDLWYCLPLPGQRHINNKTQRSPSTQDSLAQSTEYTAHSCIHLTCRTTEYNLVKCASKPTKTRQRSQVDRRRLLLHQRQTIRKLIMCIIYAAFTHKGRDVQWAIEPLLMLRPLWQKGDKLMFVCAVHMLVMSYYSKLRWQSKAHRS